MCSGVYQLNWKPVCWVSRFDIGSQYQFFSGLHGLSCSQLRHQSGFCFMDNFLSVLSAKVRSVSGAMWKIAN